MSASLWAENRRSPMRSSCTASRFCGIATTSSAITTKRQDAVQTTFIKAYDNRSRFRAGSSLSAWLYRLAYTTCIDMLRRRKFQLLTPPPAAADPDYIGDDLRRALQALSPEQRALVFGRVIEQRSFDALAVIYGKPAATLRKRYERARKKLAQALEGTPAERRRKQPYESNTR